jgi:hypothetical protein
MSLATVVLGVLATYGGRVDYRAPLLAEGNGPLVPLLFLGPAVIALGLGMATASGAPNRYPRRALVEGLAFAGLFLAVTGGFFTITIVLACGGIPMLLVGGLAMFQAWRMRRALLADGA